MVKNISEDIYTSSEWKKIHKNFRATLNEIDFSLFQRVLLPVVAKYRAELLAQKPSLISADLLEFRSNKNRKFLKRAIKVAEGVLLLAKEELDLNTNRLRWLNELATYLSQSSLRMEFSRLDKEANIQIGKVIERLKRGRIKTSYQQLENVLFRAIHIWERELSVLEKSGPTPRIARQNLIKNLQLVWEHFEGSKATVSTDDTIIGGRFYQFVEAIIQPISLQFNSKLDLVGLRRAVKAALYDNKK